MTNINYQYDGLETVTDFVRWGGTLFKRESLYFGHGTDNAFDEAKVLVFFALQLPWDVPDQYWQSRLTAYEKQQVSELFRRRIETRKPAAYLTGEAWFAGLRFIVSEATLVPRSPIAELIAQKYEPWVRHEDVTDVLDLCTGSGCIGIASLQAFPNAEVDLVDISEEALQIAQQNVELYGLQEFAHPIQSDLFSALEGKQYDLIVSNPPYVDEIEMQALPAEFQQEPKLGLEAGSDGLDLVRRILAEAPKYLKEDGVLIVEVGVSQFYLEQEYPELPFSWFDFEHGGEGVFAIHKSELELFQSLLDERLAPASDID
ncbi:MULTISPECIES: 50S ribosomal protein L3 N(5)-glutamine methyltransferase [Thiomicrorhabdus]|uniref:Ribosomal protein uL3 glutamine methyltransferase n=1 Tax=Thiomicrorhabdus heinhorstiae TaxID=2748010 RepID=A0ABS0BU40_9GAMM|nr:MULTISPECIES: 50S ribosomal protein L3 N(5)-glutamine methyltransferase [Thiomicrorhabdus]MBF6057334.1 50S ribosomal protein L3 N(5)-glutamine methyltransferase [Thiomicrorhabdus heinhorstiae]